MQALDQDFIASLRPSFSKDDIAEMMLYFELSLKYNDVMNEQITEELKDHPVFAPIIAMQTPEMQKARNEMTQMLTRNALEKGEWDPYISDLIMQGVMYAKRGMSFQSWYEVVAMVKEFMVPYMIEEYADSNEKVIGAITGLGKLTDWAMQVIAESFFIEKRSVIEAQQKKQESLIKELENFAYVVSHDLKSPLRGISKLSEWLITDYGSKLDDNGKQQLHLLKSRVQRLDDLIEGILAYSKLGRQESSLVDIDVRAQLTEIIDLSEIGPHVSIALPEVLPTVHFDKSKLAQIFSNLISNAIKYNDKPTVAVTIEYQTQGNKHVFTVSDNGPGIEPEYHEKIFGIFQTLHTKDEVESTGIGLSIVKKIIDDAGGSINVESEMGKGTSFKVAIPITQPAS